MTEPDIRKGMPPVRLTRAEFERRYRSAFADSVFSPLQRELDAIIAAALATMDRLVCADGGNPDPSSTHGKHADEAKRMAVSILTRSSW